MYKNINGSFLYFINYQDNERELCKMEMRCLFNREINEKYFFSDIDINASKSPFIKSKIKIIYSDESLDRMVRKIKEDKQDWINLRVKYLLFVHSPSDIVSVRHASRETISLFYFLKSEYQHF